ncbi:unnamed protein product [Macrosiphum euphorbiae]|uniref:Uncharacterized protein n=1 Tax=Macrosiphum euphorbiae TaxID=13131 RepID=A0AAV0VQ66_9HEMI|nr:unnamed protein product [Macrosiphum euphorbiae]
MFTTAISVSEQWKRLQARTQQRNETVYAYFHDKMRMCRQLKLSKSESKKLMCMGLHSKDMCNVLMSRTHNEEYEVLQDLRECDEVFQSRNERFKSTSNSKSTLSKEENFKNKTNPMKSPSTQTQPIKPVMPAAFKRENPEVKCYNCQLLGHIARDCPQPRRPLKCSKCKAEGHTAKYCTTRSPDIALVEQNQTDNRTVYIKDVYLNNSTDAIKGLVDTGSTLTIIRRSLAERYGMDITPRKIQLRVYGNIPCVIGSGDTEAEVRIDTVSEKLKLLVVEDHMQNFDIIIGRTFINCANVSFIKTADQLIFAYDMPLPFTNEPDEALSEQRPFTPVTVHELHEIPAASVKMVEVNVNSTIVEVLMVNHGDEPVQLKKGTQVKRLHMAVQQSGPSQPYEEPITREKVKYNPHFTEHEVTQLINLLTEYRKCFAFNMFEVGCTKAITMDIVDNNVPVNSKPYRASAQERDTIDRIVREWKAAGIVRESESPYASPVLLVTKKSGEPRLVVDYRKLNSQTVRKVYPTPNMDDHLEVLTGAKMFCTLDLASGYLQVPLTEEAKAKTSFITPTEKGEFERMVFGLINAPYEFSR